MAGAFGIENRCPFLDRRLIEFGFSLPPQCKISGLRQKLILRKILARRGSHDALDREKEGLTVFFNKWSGKKIIWDRSLYFAFVKDIWYKTYNQIRK
jgi:asparagine synthase (glutamine-hydrolysing)